MTLDVHGELQSWGSLKVEVANLGCIAVDRIQSAFKDLWLWATH